MIDPITLLRIVALALVAGLNPIVAVLALALAARVGLLAVAPAYAWLAGDAALLTIGALLLVERAPGTSRLFARVHLPLSLTAGGLVALALAGPTPPLAIGLMAAGGALAAGVISLPLAALTALVPLPTPVQWRLNQVGLLSALALAVVGLLTPLAAPVVAVAVVGLLAWLVRRLLLRLSGAVADHAGPWLDQTTPSAPGAVAPPTADWLAEMSEPRGASAIGTDPVTPPSASGPGGAMADRGSRQRLPARGGDDWLNED